MTQLWILVGAGEQGALEALAYVIERPKASSVVDCDIRE